MLGRAVGIPTATRGIDWLELLVQVIVAAIGVVIVANLYGRGPVSASRAPARQRMPLDRSAQDWPDTA